MKPQLLLLRKTGKIKVDRVDAQEKTVITTCSTDCGGTCPLIVYTRNGVIKKISFYKDGKIPPLKGCTRGLNQHYRVYAPHRLKYPLLKVGERGEGRFRRISWEEAFNIIARKMKRIRDFYGPESIFECTYSGSIKVVLHPTLWGATYRLLNRFGGRTAFGTLTSNVGAAWASRYTYGDTSSEDSNSFSDLVNSKLIILWGFNPAETRFGTDTLYWLKTAKKKGIRIICVDPCYTDTAKLLSAEWIPIRPSTDTAMLIAMAYVLVAEDLYDKNYINQYVFGFDQLRDYLFGRTDSTLKSPEWAEIITGVSAQTILRLAREFASVKPAALIQGWAPGRTANGEQYHRAAIALQVMTGNVGISGGSGGCGGLQYNVEPGGRSLSSLVTARRLLKDSKLNFGGQGVEIKAGTWADAILRGKNGGYPSDVKMIYVVGHNILNQRQNVKKSIEAFKKVEFVVCQDIFFTPTARYADIVLPVVTNFERNDISIPWVKGNYVVFANKAIDPLWDTKPDLEIAKHLASKLGIPNFEDKSEDELLRDLYEKSMLKNYISYDELRKKGLLRLGGEPIIAFKAQIEDPQRNPFPTPSGKIEIYSLGLEKTNFCIAQFSNVIPGYDKIPRIPKFIECEELPKSSSSKKYPLQLITAHHRYRVHSQFYNIPKLRKLYKHAAWINPKDAKIRGIKDGNLIRIFNDRGAIILIAKVTKRIIPSVVRCYEGAWYDPDEDGIDRGGCVNVLIDDMLTSPAGASNFNTCLVEITKEQGK